MPQLRVFISSKMGELDDERAAVERALIVRDCEPIMFERMGARPKSAQAAYLDGVREANVYVGIFGNKYSAATEEEYREARKLGTPCFVYIKEHQVRRDAKLKSLLADISDPQMGVKYFQFKTTTELDAQVRKDIQSWLVERALSAKPQRESSSGELDIVLTKYLEFVIRNNSNFQRPWIVELPEGRSLNLDDIYVSLMVEPQRHEQLPQNDLSSKEKPKRINVALAIKDHSRLVVLGDPGAGKSTLTHYLALLFASTMRKSVTEKQRATLDVRDKDGNEYGQARLPIRLRVADYAAARRENPTLSLLAFLLHRFEIPDVSQETLQQVFLASLRDGNTLLLLDGLDEASADDRSKIAEAIKEFVDGIDSRNSIVATSRRAGYVPISGFASFVFSALESEQIAYVAGGWYLGVYKARSEDRHSPGSQIQDCLAQTSRKSLIGEGRRELFLAEFERFAKAFWAELETNVGAQRLMANPLTLTMLIELYLKGKPLARRRSELYEEMIKNLLESWEREERKIPIEETVSVWQAQNKLSPLAYWINESKSEGSASEEEIKSRLAETGIGDDHQVEDLWRRLRERTPLFTEYARGYWGFAHRTFQEYFVAQELLRRKNETADLIYHHRHEPHWEEPILLALTSVKDATDLIRTGILVESPKAQEKGFKPSRYEDVLYRDFIFAMHCVADGAQTNQELATRLAEQLVKWWFEMNAWGLGLGPQADRLDWNTFGSLRDVVVLGFYRLRETEIARQAGRIFLEELADGEEDRSRYASSKFIPQSWATEDQYGTWTIVGPYEGLKALGQECSPLVIKFFMGLMESTRAYRPTLGREAIEEMSKRKDAILPALEEMLKGDKNAKCYAAILLGEHGLTTSEAIQVLFEAILQADPEPSSGDIWTGEELRRIRKGEMRERAFNAILKIEHVTIEVATVLWNLIRNFEEEQAKIKNEMVSLIVSKSPEAWDFRKTDKLGSLERYRLSAFYLLAKCDESKVEAIRTLQQAVLYPQILNPLQFAETRLGPLLQVPFEDIVPILFEFVHNSHDVLQAAMKSSGLVGFAALLLSKLQQASDEIVTKVIELTRQHDPYVRSDAVTLLSVLKRRLPEIYSCLIGLLEDQDDRTDYFSSSSVPYKAAEALYEIGEIPAEFLPKILSALSKDGRRTRWPLVKIFADGKVEIPESSRQEVAVILLNLFQVEDPDSSTLEKAEEALGRLALFPEVMPLLLDALKSEHGRVQSGANWALTMKLGWGQEPTPDATFLKKRQIPLETIKILLEALADSNSKVSQRALGVLWSSANKPPELVDGLHALLSHPAPCVRCRALNVLLWHEIKDAEVIGTWLDLMRNDNDEIRLEAADLASRLPMTPDVVNTVLFAARNDKSPMVRAKLLDQDDESWSANVKFRAAMVQALKDDSPIVRGHALIKLKYTPQLFNDQKGVLQIISNPDPFVGDLKEVYEALPDEERTQLISEMDIEKERVELRKNAINHLGYEGHLDKETLDLLISLLDDDNDEIRSSVCQALGMLFVRFLVGFRTERELVADRLYAMLKNPKDTTSDVWEALWRTSKGIPA